MIADMLNEPDSLYGTILMHSVRMALLDSIREDLATSPVALRSFLLKADTAGKSIATMDDDKKLTAQRRLHGIYAGCNDEIRRCCPPSPSLVWSIGVCYTLEWAVGSFAGAEVHRQALVTLFQTCRRDLLLGRGVWRARVSSLLTGIGLSELFVHARDSSEMVCRWKRKLQNLLSVRRPQTKHVALMPVPELPQWSTNPRARQAETSKQRWDLSVRLAIATALYEFRGSPAASTAFLDALFHPAPAETVPNSIHAVSIPPRSSVLTLVTAEHIAAMFQIDTYTLDPAEIWELVELTMLFKTESRRNIAIGLSSQINDCDIDGTRTTFLDDDDFDEMTLEIAVRCQHSRNYQETRA
jgi:hypothetical protein